MKCLGEVGLPVSQGQLGWGACRWDLEGGNVEAQRYGHVKRSEAGCMTYRDLEIESARKEIFSFKLWMSAGVVATRSMSSRLV